MSVRDTMATFAAKKLTKHFADSITGIHLYLPSMLADTSKSNWCQLHIGGPNFYEPSNDIFFVTVPFRFLVGTKPNNENIYQQETNLDLITEHCVDINVLNDSGVLINIFKLSPLRGGQPLRIEKYGNVNKGVKFLQATISGQYEITLEET